MKPHNQENIARSLRKRVIENDISHDAPLSPLLLPYAGKRFFNAGSSILNDASDGKIKPVRPIARTCLILVTWAIK